LLAICQPEKGVFKRALFRSETHVVFVRFNADSANRVSRAFSAMICKRVVATAQLACTAYTHG
jgi:hypothetical protein